ncbi:MAG TPA: hypothetical protein VFP72_13545 [Kineosporiaceae bacterium]|nr:hypothetical protein [Kineosporiaceae bacterium]
MLIGVITAALAAGAFGVASILQSIGARREPTTDRIDLLLLFRLLRHPVFVVSVLFSAVGFGLHMVALRLMPLFAVQPMIAGSVAVTAVLQAWRRVEPLGRRGRLLVLAVCAGLGLVTVSAVSSAAVHPSVAERRLLLVAVAVICLAGWVGGLVRGPVGASLLGVLSGLGFAIVAVSARSMPSVTPFALVADPAAYALALAGGVAFLLYSTALQRGTVITATAAMVVANTVAPVLAGVFWLGDRFRPGWEPAAAVGLVIAGAAVVLLHDPREPASGPHRVNADVANEH